MLEEEELKVLRTFIHSVGKMKTARSNNEYLSTTDKLAFFH